LETWSLLGHRCLDDPSAREAFDLLPIGIAVWGLDERPRLVNRVGAEIWGLARAAEGPPPGPRVVGVDAEVEHPAVAALRADRDPVEEAVHDLIIARADGGSVTVRSRLRALRDAQGALIGIVDTFTRSEPPRAVPSDRLERAYGEIADALPFIMWRADASGRTVSCNRRFWAYAGLARGERPDWTLAVHIDDRPRARALWAQCVATDAMYTVELRLRRFDGSHHWYLARAWPVRSADGAIGHWLGTCTNIDELKRLEFELRRCNEELESFAGVASHDLQEPLRMVANFLDLLRKRAGPVLDVTSLEYLAFAHDGARRMQQLIRKLLDYSRIGRAPQPSVPVDAMVVAREAILDLNRVIEESRAEISLGPLPAVRVERVQLGQLLQNLIANGLKYRSEAPPRIDISAAREGGEWEFRVSDNGIGIAFDNQQRIFGLFQRLHGEGEYPGAGIGLAVCKKIVENHGGKIWVSSEPGKGSCFHFTLPVV
jgi:PAS domain S-box-containing protein